METKLFEENFALARKVYEALKLRAKTVASAESCTGGLLATFLTEEAGSSRVYQGGVNCYSNESKSKILSVPISTIESKGAVSKEVALQLAKNVRELFHVDFGISITGIAGPDGGTPLKPVGTVWACISQDDGEFVWCSQFKGNRHSIRLQSIQSVLNEFLKKLKG